MFVIQSYHLNYISITFVFINISDIALGMNLAFQGNQEGH